MLGRDRNIGRLHREARWRFDDGAVGLQRLIGGKPVGNRRTENCERDTVELRQPALSNQKRRKLIPYFSRSGGYLGRTLNNRYALSMFFGASLRFAISTSYFSWLVPQQLLQTPIRSP